MANDHYQFNARDQRRSGGGGAGEGDILSHLKKYYASSIPLPPVPHAQARLLQTPQKPISKPIIDPETMPAKQGLNEWGAFTGRGKIASSSGLFGLGPLLFRQASDNDSKKTSSPSPLTDQDWVEKDRLQRSDPDSFNPMRAVWWARLDDDEDVADDEASPVQREKESDAKGTEIAESLQNSDDGLKYQQSISAASINGPPHQNGRDDRVAFDKSTVTHSGGVPIHTSTPRDVHQRYSQDTRFPLVPTKHVGTAFSDAVVAGPDGHSVFVPPVAVSISNPMRQHNSIPPNGRHQNKHSHHHDTQASPNPTDLYVMRQDSSCLPSEIPITMPPFSFSTQQDHIQHLQLAPANYSTRSSSLLRQTFPPPPPSSPEQENASLLLCLAPSCQARFSTEAQLYAHYQAVHTSGSNQPDRDDLHQSYTSSSLPSISLACSWIPCRAGGFKSNNALMWHVKAEHLLQCPLPACCNRVFRSRKQAEEHARKRLSCL